MRAPDAWTIAFASGTLDRAVTLRSDPDVLHAPAARFVLVGPGQTVALHGDELAREAPPATGERALLGREAGEPLCVADAGEAPAQRFTALREAASVLSPSEAALAGYAVALVAWQRTHRFCGRCGTPTVGAQAGHRRDCPRCGLHTFPRTDPVVTMVIEAGERALLTRRRGAIGVTWSAVAGFVEPGETPEEALVREAEEEVGVRVTAVEYVGAQPWPFPHVLMLGYRARADGEQAPAAVRDTEELADARWYDRAQLRAELEAGTVSLPPAIAIGHWLIRDWLDRLS